MTQSRILFIWLVLFLALFWPGASLAQAPTEVKVIYPAVEEGEDSLSLSVYFTITDGDNRPISQANPESPAAIQLLDGGEQLSAAVEKPQTPFYVVLLLDASGSMAGVMPQVREAAKEAIQSIPPAAQMTVIQFSDKPTRILPNFTNDQNRIKEAIDRVEAVPNGNTCLYDSLYSTMELLDQQIQQPQERRAIIVFTDGKDEKRDTKGPCSVYAYGDVVDRAKKTPNTPIHTIGLCDGPQCGNINKAELQTMALDTFAFSLTGSKTDLGDLFREIITGLSTQWVARANVFANKGANQAVLRVKLPGQNNPLNDDFTFLSNRQYKRSAGPVRAQISGLTYDPDKDVYRLALSLISPETVGKVYVEVWDKKSGTQILPNQTFENPGETIPEFERETKGFQPGREYSFKVKVEDKNGLLIQNDKGETTLAQNDITYEPVLPETVKFVIESVKTNYDTGKMTIDLNVPDEGQVERYEGLIVDSSGQEVERFGPEVYLNKRLALDLPVAMRQPGTEPQEYKLTIYLTTKSGLRLPAEYTFKTTPPLPPGLWERILGAILHPVVWGSALVIFLCIAGVFYLKSRPRSEAIPAPFRPGPAAPPPPVAGVTVDIPRLRLEVLQTPNMSQRITKVITEFPYTIGRSGEGDLKISDETVSRQHIQILLRDNEFFLTDLGSTYGTFIEKENKKLEPHQPILLRGSTVVKLGRRTHLRLDP